MMMMILAEKVILSLKEGGPSGHLLGQGKGRNLICGEEKCIFCIILVESCFGHYDKIWFVCDDHDNDTCDGDEYSNGSDDDDDAI